MAAVESGYLKSELVASHAERRARIESGEDKVVGVNCYESTEPSPLTADLDTAVMTVDPQGEERLVKAVQDWRTTRDEPYVWPPSAKALQLLKEAAATDANLMEATLECVRAGVTTGEWAGALREVFGEFRAPTGVSSAPVAVAAEPGSDLAGVRARVEATAARTGRRPAAAAGGQARSRRALQRRRADRRTGPRRRLRGRLPGHPAHPGADRLGGRRRGRALRRPVHPLRLARLARPRRARAAAATPEPTTCPWSSAASSPPPTRRRCAPPAWRPSSHPRTSGSREIIGRIVDQIRIANTLEPLEVPA